MITLSLTLKRVNGKWLHKVEVSMTKRKLFIIVVLIILQLTSCQPVTRNNETSNQDNNDYFVLLYNQKLVKINCETAVSTTICQDPLCDHSEIYIFKCPFYCTSYAVSDEDNLIYFIHPLEQDPNFNPKEYKPQYQIRKYDLMTGELTNCYVTSNFVTSNLVYKKSLYFTESVYEKKENGEIKKYSNVYRISEDKTLKKLNDEIIEGRITIYEILNERIYFFADEVNFNSNLDYADLQESKSHQKEYDWEFTMDNVTNAVTIKSEKDANGNRVIITDKANMYFIIDEYIYYQKCLDEKKLVFVDKAHNKKTYTDVESKLYRAKYDGSENELFCDFGERLEPIKPLLTYNDCVKGNYFIVQFTKYVSTDSGVIVELEYAVMNIKTRKYKMVT